MQLAQVIIEHPVAAVDTPFDYYVPAEFHVVPGIRVQVDFHLQTLIGYVVGVSETEKTIEDLNQSYGFELKPIQGVIDSDPLLTDELEAVAKWLAEITLSPLISCYQALLPPTLKPSSGLKIGKKMRTMYAIIPPYSEIGLARKQLELYQQVGSMPAIARTDLSSGPSTIKTLIEKGKIRAFEEEVYRDPYKEILEIIRSPTLTNEQEEAINAIQQGSETTYLLEGITGSGKTEVYIHLAEDSLKVNQTTLVLVPEISLTPQMVRRFRQRLGDTVAVFHSALSEGEKYDEYRRIARGEAKVVIGARSAIFVPLTAIKYIIIDEEHSETYKQDSTPRYHAREVAIERAKYHHSKIVLGSATPSLETKARAVKGVYKNLFLTKRIGMSVLPPATLVNMLEEGRKNHNYSPFSTILLSKIQSRLDQKEQVLILLNRRGYASSVQCRQCGYIMRCPSCDIPLTYHKTTLSLKCHYCDHEENLPSKCPNCQSSYLRTLGMGTQRLEEELVKHFPSAHIVRMDRDTVRKKNGHQLILDKFETGQYDILIGTQMIAKGLDYPNVTLVGVINADIGLSYGYRASERTFQLIMQVSGRSGRGQKPGETIIQTNNPEHYAIALAASHNFNQFYKIEMEYRRIRHYPPYRFLVRLIFEGKKFDKVSQETLRVKNLFIQEKIDQAEVLGPSIPYLAHFNEKERMTLLIKYFHPHSLHLFLKELYRLYSSHPSVSLVIDFDPLDD